MSLSLPSFPVISLLSPIIKALNAHKIQFDNLSKIFANYVKCGKQNMTLEGCLIEATNARCKVSK